MPCSRKTNACDGRLQASKLREEIALVLPGRGQQGQGKKKIPTGDAD